MTSKDFTVIPNTTANEIQENITTHNILVTTMIIHYLQDYQMANRSTDDPIYLRFHRTFTMLVLHLIQCPDLTFEELNNLMSCGKYQLPSHFIRRFHIKILRVINNDVDGMVDMFKCIDGNFVDSGLPKVHHKKTINGSSPIGIFLRRGVIFFDKMLFLQIEAVIKELKNSCSALVKEFSVRTNKEITLRQVCKLILFFLRDLWTEKR